MRALVTGASMGIGEAAARILSKKGYDLIITARSKEKLEALKEELPTDVRIVVCDLSQKEGPQKLYDEVKDLNIDILINSAGMGDCGEFIASSFDKQYNMMMVNCMALMHLSYLFGGKMKDRGKGHILNISSSATFNAGAYMSVYYASKAFVLHFSNALAQELKDTGVRVTCLCPGAVDTGFMEKADMGVSSMHRFFPPASSDKIAGMGIKAMLKGRTMAVPGVGGHLLNLASRMLPRAVMEKIVADVNRKRVIR